MNGNSEQCYLKHNNVILNNKLLYCINEGDYDMYECLSCARQSTLETKTTKYICFSFMEKCHDQAPFGFLITFGFLFKPM